jgi:hypothetical protein
MKHHKPNLCKNDIWFVFSPICFVGIHAIFVICIYSCILMSNTIYRSQCSCHLTVTWWASSVDIKHLGCHQWTSNTSVSSVDIKHLGVISGHQTPRCHQWTSNTSGVISGHQTSRVSSVDIKHLGCHQWTSNTSVDLYTQVHLLLLVGLCLLHL